MVGVVVVEVRVINKLEFFVVIFIFLGKVLLIRFDF